MEYCLFLIEKLGESGDLLLFVVCCFLDFVDLLNVVGLC